MCSYRIFTFSFWLHSVWQEVSRSICVSAKLLQLCLILCDPMDYSPPGSSVHGSLQARMLEWVAMPSSRGSSLARDRTCISYVSCIGRWVLYHWYHLGSPWVHLHLCKWHNSILFNGWVIFRYIYVYHIVDYGISWETSRGLWGENIDPFNLHSLSTPYLLLKIYIIFFFWSSLKNICLFFFFLSVQLAGS